MGLGLLAVCFTKAVPFTVGAAFDPAGPGFEGLPRLVRLNRYSANFVDVLHTNAKPITALGFGIMESVGELRAQKTAYDEHSLTVFVILQRIPIFCTRMNLLVMRGNCSYATKLLQPCCYFLSKLRRTFFVWF